MFDIYIYIYIYSIIQNSNTPIFFNKRFIFITNVLKVKAKLATFAESDPEAPFSIATILRCRGERYSIP